MRGEYLNGRKWNGKVYNIDRSIYILKDGKGFIKEYKYTLIRYRLIFFEGEYVNGQRNGKGKKYIIHNDKIKMKFEGEYLNGKKHGKGKKYKNGNLIIEGEYSNEGIKKFIDENITFPIINQK